MTIMRLSCEKCRTAKILTIGQRGPLAEPLEPYWRKAAARIKVVYLEDCVTYLQKEETIPEKLRVHAFNLAEKYIPTY